MILPDHTVTIDNLGFYAKNPQVDQPFRKRKWEQVEIAQGPPRTYRLGMQLRRMSFEAELRGSPSDVRDQLETINDKIVTVTSPYIGSFRAYVEIKYNINDGYPDVLYTTVDIIEVDS